MSKESLKDFITPQIDIDQMMSVTAIFFMMFLIGGFMLSVDKHLTFILCVPFAVVNIVIWIIYAIMYGRKSRNVDKEWLYLGVVGIISGICYICGSYTIIPSLLFVICLFIGAVGLAGLSILYDLKRLRDDIKFYPIAFLAPFCIASVFLGLLIFKMNPIDRNSKQTMYFVFAGIMAGMFFYGSIGFFKYHYIQVYKKKYPGEINEKTGSLKAKSTVELPWFLDFKSKK